MDWIWDNLQLILVVAGSIAVWINQHRREKNGEPADFDEDGIPDNRKPPVADARSLTPASRDGMDPEQAERVRRIQEEIRRKIAERRGQAVPPPLAPQPAFEEPGERPMVFREEPGSAPPPMPPVREVVVAYDDSAALERQRRLEEQMAELEKQRRETRRAAQAFAESGEMETSLTGMPAPAWTAGAGLGARAVVDELRDPKAVRRAWVLREVLGTPVALR